MHSIRLRQVLALFAAAIMVSTISVSVAGPAWGSADDHPRPHARGMVIVESNRSFEQTWATLVDALNANPNIRLIAIIDHGAAAQSVGLELGGNRVAVFGNPNLGAPLMQINQTVGIDLPQKIHVFEQRGSVWVGFNDTNYLAARHGVGEAATLPTIAGALRALTGQAGDQQIDDEGTGVGRLGVKPALITVPSDADIDTTWARLLAAIDASPANVAFTVDHEAAAASVGLDLAPTRLVAFGNPMLGTPLMQEHPSSGIDLPIKFLVWQDESGETMVTTNDVWLAKRHGINQTDLGPISNAVANFLAAATTTR